MPLRDGSSFVLTRITGTFAFAVQPSYTEYDSSSFREGGERGNPTRMKIDRRDGESIEQLLRRFNKIVVAERITKTFREKMQFVSKSEQRKEKRRRAERNRRKKMAQTGH